MLGWLDSTVVLLVDIAGHITIHYLAALHSQTKPCVMCPRNPNTQTNQFSVWFTTLNSLHISASETQCNVPVCKVRNEVCALPCVFAIYSWQHTNIKAHTGKLGHSSGQLNSVTVEKEHLHCWFNTISSVYKQWRPLFDHSDQTVQ